MPAISGVALEPPVSARSTVRWLGGAARPWPGWARSASGSCRRSVLPLVLQSRTPEKLFSKPSGPVIVKSYAWSSWHRDRDGLRLAGRDGVL